MGLLRRVLLYLKNSRINTAPETRAFQEGIEFYRYAEKMGMGPCAVLILIDGVYCVKQSFGFTAETIIKSVSSPDFWEGVFTAPEDGGWLVKENGETASFYQFFAEADREKLKSLMLKRFSLRDGAAAIWMGYGGKDAIPAADKLIQKITATGIDFPITDFGGKNEQPVIPAGLLVNLFEIDFSDVAEALPQSTLTAQNVNFSLELLLSLARTIFYGAYYLCEPLFAKPNSCNMTRDSCLRAAVYSAGEIDPYVLYLQLAAALTPYFPDTALEALQIYNIGTASTPASVLSFLRATD
ncbi:MAG: hypothetical protein Pg6C_09200 [Treponemataceae bacterium]|nr:MAG: hypothetical protein Pg6C_09200 [Treponemataceae bacterium]